MAGKGVKGWLCHVFLVALAYGVTGRLGVELALPPGYATAVWPPSGIALAAVLIGGSRVWPGIMLGSAFVNTTVFVGQSLPEILSRLAIPLCIGAGAALQAVVGGVLVRRLGNWPNQLADIREIALLLFYGGLLACLINASVGSITLWFVGKIPGSILPYHWSTWWAGDVMGVFVFTPLVLMVRNAGLAGQRRVLTTCFWITCTFSATAMAVSYSLHVERDKQKARFEQTAQEMKASLEGIIADHLGALQTVEGFYAGGERRGLAEFTLFSRRVREQVAGLLAIEWVPRVPAQGRAELETWARAQGLGGFALTDRDDGHVVTAPPRSEYYPITLVEPMTGNLANLGYDLNSYPDLQEVLVQARDSGRAAASRRIRLVQGDDGAVMALPLFDSGTLPETVAERRDTLKGFVLGVIRLRALARMAFESHNLQGLDYWLLDESDNADPLAANTAQPAQDFTLSEHGLFGGNMTMGVTYNLPFGDRQWRLKVAPNRDFMAQSQGSVNWVVLFGGMLMTGVVGMFVMVATGREEALRRMIDLHTSQFLRQNESLRLLNNIASMPIAGLREQLVEALKLGARHLNLEIGIVSRIEGRTYSVEQAVAPPEMSILPGTTYPLGNTYCSLTLDRGDALAVSQMGISPFAAHPSYQAFRLEAYIGAPILVHGRVFGTVNFSSPQPYHRPFDDGDLEFIRLLARWLGAAIEREEAQDALMTAHRRLAAILDNSPVGIAIVGFDRMVMQANKAFCAIFGLGMGEVVGKSARVLYSSDETFAAIGARSMPLLSQGQTFDEDVPMMRRDGKEILVRLIAREVDSGDRSHGIVWAAEDVTERRAAEVALRERQEFFEHIFISGAAIKLLLDPQTGQIVDANPAAASFYGVGLDQLRGRFLWTLDELEPEQSMALLRAAQGDANSRFIYRHVMADGSHRDVEVFSGPLRVRGRDLVLSIVHDVTDRLQSEQRLAQALQEQEAQAKELARSNAELEQFAYVASHDLRQPLRQVASYVSLLERMYGNKLDIDAKQFIHFARSGAERMDRLIVDLLEYSRIGRRSPGLESVPVDEMLAEPVRIMALLVEESGGRIILKVAADIGSVMGDRIELERLVQNLLGNALKYRAPDRPPEVTVSAQRLADQNLLRISVADNGIGIAEEHFDRIFGIFQRLHGREEYEGTGIGLAVCKKIVDHHRGNIWLASRLGEGTVFHVDLPLMEGAE